MTAEATGPRSREERLEWESRVGRLAGAAAVGALLLPAAAQLYLRYGIGMPPRELPRRLEFLAARPAELGLISAGQALGLLLLGAALAFLVAGSRYRREATPGGAMVIVAVGTLATAGATVAQAVDTLMVSSEFVAGARTPARAQEVVQGGGAGTLLQIALGANLAFGVALVLTSVSAMRAGLLSRFMGILGVVVGVLFGLGGNSGAFLLFFWSGALALILLDRWPGGRGPAWASGEADPWPTAAERRVELQRAEEESEPEPEEPAERPPRKRKRRR